MILAWHRSYTLAENFSLTVNRTSNLSRTCCPWGPKALMLVCVGTNGASGHLPWVLRQWHLRLIIRVIMVPNQRPMENLGKPQLRNRLTKVVRPVIASNEVSYLLVHFIIWHMLHSPPQRVHWHRSLGLWNPLVAHIQRCSPWATTLVYRWRRR